MSDQLKKQAAIAVLEYINEPCVLGIGTGSTVAVFIQELARIKNRIEACVASSVDTQARLKAVGIPVIDLNSTTSLPLYIDGADEVCRLGRTIKGGGGALTREKIIATAADQFICLVEDRKLVNQLGRFPVAVEVIPMARSFVARELVKLGGDPHYRMGFTTDNHNIIIDVSGLNLNEPTQMEQQINAIPGVVENGLFAQRLADITLVAYPQNITEVLTRG